MSWPTTLAFRGISLFLLCCSVLCCNTSHSNSGEKPTLLVFAASSLREAFEQIAVQFESQHPGLDVQLSFSGSQVLRLQLEQGAHADVYASASQQHIESLRSEGVVETVRVFAENQLVVIVPLDNPSAIGNFRQLRRARRLIVGSDRVPVGQYTHQLFNNASQQMGSDFSAEVQQYVVSRENNVRLVRAKVELGEADAAIVYRTDALASSRLVMVDIAPELNVRAKYWAGALARSSNKAGAAQFISYLSSPAGRRVLRKHGFLEVQP